MKKSRSLIFKDKCEEFDKKNWFYNWFVGYTDGDGCFNVYINIKLKKIIFTFKISQKSNNIQVLYYFKKELKCGKVRSDKFNMSHFLVRDRVSLKKKIIPIFDEFNLLSKKEFSYFSFKECLNIVDDIKLTQEEKIFKISEIKKKKIPLNYVSTAWNKKKDLLSNNKAWLVGFIEAEGSFYLVKKSDSRIVHGFGITQKTDKIILDNMKLVLKINGSVKFNKNGFYSLDSLDWYSLKFIKIYFFKTMKSIKALQYRIWARSFKYKGKYKKLLLIQQLLRKIQ